MAKTQKHKPRSFGRPRATTGAKPQFSRSKPVRSGGGFQPLPPPTGASPFHLDLTDVLPADLLTAIRQKKRMVCHVTGDSGGVKDPNPQQLVALAMERDFEDSPASPVDNPAFFYHVGDVVYFNGQDSEYLAQFYEPYEHYMGPIIAIPGNHDGSPLGADTTLAGFVRNFCTATPGESPDAGNIGRDTMTQPNVFFTLLTPMATFIGLYTNVPEHGKVHQDQIDWFHGELSSAPADLPVLVAMHHPIYSADDHHSGSGYMGGILDDAIQASGRIPDMVLAGHVHNYQRFTSERDGRDVPFLVTGAGGYHNLHKVAKVNGEKVIPPLTIEGGVTLERYLDDRFGFLRLEFSSGRISGKYYGAPRPQEPWSGPAKLIDSFTLDVANHKLL